MRNALLGSHGASIMMRSIVIGIGNVFRSDDAAGWIIAERLDGRRSDTVLRHNGEPTSLMALWKGCDQVILIDAVRSGAPAGTVTRLDVSEVALPPNWVTSTHSMGVREAIELARLFGSLPESVIVYGIEADTVEIGDELSNEVAAAIDQLVEELAHA